MFALSIEATREQFSDLFVILHYFVLVFYIIGFGFAFITFEQIKSSEPWTWKTRVAWGLPLTLAGVIILTPKFFANIVSLGLNKIMGLPH